jgi:hypothetical protein
MRDDGMFDVALTAHRDGLDPDFDALPTIRGVAWISSEATMGVSCHVWYAFPAQEHTRACTGNAGAGGVPVDFGDRYGRDLYGTQADDLAIAARRERDIQDGVLHGGVRVGDRGYWLGGQYIEVE